jgi:hypothetical protein
LFGAAEFRSKGSELVGDQLGGLGVDPPHEVIVLGVEVCVLDGELGLSDATHAV